MDKETPATSVREGRRGFLKLAVAGTAGAAAATVVAKPAEAAEQAPGPGYSETEHVRTYYRSCRF